MKNFLVALFLLVSVNVFSQTTDWVKSFGGADSDKGISIGCDSLGFIYCSGFFNNQATFGGITLTNSNLSTSGNNKENFVFKMDSLGNVLWAIAGGNLSGGCCDDRALGMHVTPGGDVFITGTFWSSYNLGTLSVTQNAWGTALNNHDNSLLAKIDKDGVPQWVVGFGADNTSGGCPWPIYDADDHSYDVKVDVDGFIYVTGFFSGYSAEFDNLSIANPDWDVTCEPMGYIGKLDQNGNWLWVDKFDGIKDQRGSRDNRLAIDQFSNIYVVGGFQNTGNYGPFSITSNGEWDAFVFKMDKDGNWLWADNVGSNKTDRANSIAVDVCGDVYVTGEYRNPMVFPGANASNGTDTLSHKKKRDVFVAKMNNQGDWKWAKRARSSGTDKPYQMSVDVNKQVFIGGTTKGEMTFTNGLTISPQIAGDTSASAWVAQIDGASSNGDWVWAKMGGTDTDDDDRTGDICPDGFGNVYAIGFYEDSADFDGTILNSLGRKDIFVWKMSMTPGSFTVNNTFDTVYSEIMVFNPADTGTFITNHIVLDGCDTLFTDSVVYKRLGVQINYNINNPGTATFNINGVVQAMPYTQNYWAGETISIEAALQPGWLFSQWKTYGNTVLPAVSSTIASFVANISDSCVLYTYLQPPLSAFISGSDTICDNANKEAEVKISFAGATSPYTFVYAIDGENQPSITTTLNPYIIHTKEEGNYTLTSFIEAATIGWVSGSAMITIQQSPNALFTTATDTLSILYPSVQLTDVSIGTIVAWSWDFGDNSVNDFSRNPYHTYKDSLGIYQLSLIVLDNKGCSDTVSKQIWVADEYWMYIPNSFTPDYDGMNDVFCLSYNGIRESTFLFNIYDRFSNLVYASENISELECFLNSNGWDGKHYETGNDLPMGTYVYEVYFQDFEGWKHQERGHLFIIR
ncbi:MAG: T9SS type B sorting domain-containing protein [Flavobacteriales bacterium]|jgi:gliding motility-associated-like protein|nr:T9SS type B sorting domain-containing protein [Flavobacteriales bacterium]|tara:strand:+ start:2866 stop:5604 length:2739 start_codon:yes stop_codon:yes gene_type:complete